MAGSLLGVEATRTLLLQTLPFLELQLDGTAGSWGVQWNHVVRTSQS